MCSGAQLGQLVGSGSWTEDLLICSPVPCLWPSTTWKALLAELDPDKTHQHTGWTFNLYTEKAVQFADPCEILNQTISKNLKVFTLSSHTIMTNYYPEWLKSTRVLVGHSKYLEPCCLQFITRLLEGACVKEWTWRSRWSHGSSIWLDCWGFMEPG